MKSLLITLAVIFSLLGLAGYFFYRSYMIDIVAHAVVSESLPAYVPKRLKRKVEKMRAPLNKGTEAVLKKMHESDVPLERVLTAVDKTTEEEAYAFLDEVNARKPATTNEVFDIAKKYFSADFDIEVFRQPFNEHVSMKQLRTAIAYANANRKENNVDVATGKAILKKILIEKDKVIREP
jgi:hypothetical protein